ncbi:HEAT repeat domain-containing protein [Streptomyces synnematoformans]|uniref:HEAT repeat domain-containing protein n=1 Tax=Streptomyces synnematoformans TaxID=415721 RepID=A0ABP5KII3_9ACTN
MTSHIETLVQQLDGKADESYDARAELIWIGADAIPAVINGLPSLGGFGQLTAIEVFEEVGDPRCGPALIGLLDSDNPTVREWAAMALASLEIDDAIEPLRRAYRAYLERATPPDWTESVGIRWALTELGVRNPVVPPLTAHLRATAAEDAPGWPSAHFTEIINDLADHAQVILYSQFWRVDSRRGLTAGSHLPPSARRQSVAIGTSLRRERHTGCHAANLVGTRIHGPQQERPAWSGFQPTPTPSGLGRLGGQLGGR